MATLTQVKRDGNPKRYVRKDARSMIFRVLFGKQEHTYDKRNGQRSNDPSADHTRIFSTFWTWEEAKAVWDRWHELAQFTPETHAKLVERLDSLKHKRVGE